MIRKGGAKLLLQAREKSRGLLVHEDFRGGAATNNAKAKSGLPVRLADDMFPLPSARTQEEEHSTNTRVSGSRDTTVQIISET